MEAQQIIDLALNARLNHWPPHLGVKTDAEKIEYLATELDKAATEIVRYEGISDQLETLREESAMYEQKATELREQLDKIHNLSMPPK